MPETADFYGPFDAGPGANMAEAGWRQMMSQLYSSGVVVNDTYPGGGLVPTAGTGLQALVSAGSVWIQGHIGEWEDQTALTVTANASGSTRVDAIVARCDFVNNLIELDIVAGTPGAGVPSLTQTTSEWEILIGAVTLASGGSTVTVADWRTLTGSAVTGRLLGEAIDHPSGAIPSWALELNGQAVSRTEYAALFALWGTTFGAGNGSSTFNVPDRRGRVAVGQNTGDSDFDTIGEVGGAKTHTLTTAQIPSHTHTGSTNTDGAHTHAPVSGGSVWASSGSSNSQFGHPGFNTLNGAFAATSSLSSTAHSHAFTTNSAGSGGSHNNLQPYQVTRWICRAR